MGRQQELKVSFAMSNLREAEQTHFPPSHTRQMTASLPRSPPPSALGSEPALPLSGTRQEEALIASQVFSSPTNPKKSPLASNTARGRGPPAEACSTVGTQLTEPQGLRSH